MRPMLLSITVLGICLCADIAIRARPIPPTPLPVSRLVANLNDRVKANPNDVQATFTLGRVHYFAFAGATDRLNTTGDRGDGMPGLYDFLGQPGKSGSVSAPSTRALDEATRVEHLKNAVVYLTRAVELKKNETTPVDGRYELCLACALEEGAAFAAKVGPLAGLTPTANAWEEAAINYYARAFDAAVQRDASITRRPVWGLGSLVATESGASYERLLDRRRATRSKDELNRVNRIREFRQTVERLPPGPITPLVFSLETQTDLPDLLSGRSVRFDLNGSGLPQRYGWVRGSTAVLVWDPAGTGQITSGRQLFGSVTWWMFWDHAYQSLAGLDDDANGWVDGHELRGLAVWRDQNENGVSETTEVVPLSKTMITGLAAQATGRTGDAVMHAAGLRLRDGRVLPTFDWVAQAK